MRFAKSSHKKRHHILHARKKLKSAMNCFCTDTSGKLTDLSVCKDGDPLSEEATLGAKSPILPDDIPVLDSCALRVETIGQLDAITSKSVLERLNESPAGVSSVSRAGTSSTSSDSEDETAPKAPSNHCPSLDGSTMTSASSVESEDENSKEPSVVYLSSGSEHEGNSAYLAENESADVIFCGSSSGSSQLPLSSNRVGKGSRRVKPAKKAATVTECVTESASVSADAESNGAQSTYFAAHREKVLLLRKPDTPPDCFIVQPPKTGPKRSNSVLENRSGLPQSKRPVALVCSSSPRTLPSVNFSTLRPPMSGTPVIAKFVCPQSQIPSRSPSSLSASREPFKVTIDVRGPLVNLSKDNCGPNGSVDLAPVERHARMAEKPEVSRQWKNKPRHRLLHRTTRPVHSDHTKLRVIPPDDGGHVIARRNKLNREILRSLADPSEQFHGEQPPSKPPRDTYKPRVDKEPVLSDRPQSDDVPVLATEDGFEAITSESEAEVFQPSPSEIGTEDVAQRPFEIATKVVRPPSLLNFGRQVIPVTDSACWLLVNQSSVTIAGVTRVSCYAGQVDVAGYRMNNRSDQLTIASLDSEAWISIHAVGDPVNRKDFEDYALKFFTREIADMCSEVLMDFPDQVYGVLLLTSSNSVCDPVIWSCLRMFPTLMPNIISNAENERPRNAVYLPMGRNLRARPFNGCDLLSSRLMEECPRNIDYKVSKESNQNQVIASLTKSFWKEVQDALEPFAEKSRPVILLCGHKNVGKSTTVRYIINSLLRKFPVVQCLDCDIGQSEFNPPGCLAIHSFTAPVVGPPFCRLHKADAALYLGEVTPSPIVRQYENGLQFVIDKGRNPDVPLVVNTMGWVERLGLQLLQHTSSLVTPDVIIELTTSESTGIASKLFKAQNARVIEITSAVSARDVRKHFPPAFKRKVSIIAYLCQVFTPFAPINTAVPYKIGFSDVAIYYVDAMIPPSHYFSVLLGSYVGLATWDSENTTIPVERVHGVTISREAPSGLCRGFGIVRAIDVPSRTIFLLTSLAETELLDVNLLIRGSISIPEEIYLNQDIEKWEGLVPRLQYRYAFE